MNGLPFLDFAAQSLAGNRITRKPARYLWLAILAASLVWTVSAAVPVVSNIRAAQRPGTHLVDIFYNVSDPDGTSPLTIYVAVSDDGGATFKVPVFTLSGAVGPGVLPGNDRQIVWNAGTDWAGRFSSQCKVKISADDGIIPAPPPVAPAPPGMVLIPAGSFQMGDTFADGGADERPFHAVYASGFFMDKFEVTRALWQEVNQWTLDHGYTFENVGQSKASDHPVHSINWYDAVKWCNARSEKEGMTPAYYTSAAQTTVYRTGRIDVQNDWVKWNVGYRLPTEAEWEKAARGGLLAQRFPWGNTITHSQANYGSTADFPYDVSPTRGFHPGYKTGGMPYTSPVGSFAANAYALYDMAGNGWEWCWDWYSSDWYGQSEATQRDPRGPGISSGYRVLRGGVWYADANGARCAYRGNELPGRAMDYAFGFRCVRAVGF